MTSKKIRRFAARNTPIEWFWIPYGAVMRPEIPVHLLLPSRTIFDPSNDTFSIQKDV